ncbi:ATP-dependent peptidase [Heracleum sosnowskyi]|uniref:ATP-dependent peptidase n=1 Tax=Heracleum sosnowskyi TaxID=360622 RepID=A0AAD8MVH2_9APIA|nr:ATP-dependent peptidase [Heracleum sosnowskyi]
MQLDAVFRLIYASQKRLLNLTRRLSCQYLTNPNVVSNGSTTFRSFGDVSDGDSKKKEGKVKSIWVCESCGYSNAQWLGACRSCDSVGKMKRFVEAGGEKKTTSGFRVSEKVGGTSWLEQDFGDAGPVRLTDVNVGVDNKDWRIPLSGLFGDEVARVLGGGLVPGSLILVGGPPGIGKSTLLLQIATIIAKGHAMSKSAPVVYISGEETVEQIKNRADRMKLGTEELFLYTRHSTDVEDILEKALPISPRALIVDSIQAVHSKGVTGNPGDISQVKKCAKVLLGFAKKTNIPVFLIGHVNKSGNVSGPRLLEHLVDAVLYLEGEKQSSNRFLQPVKNRFGSTDELGVFEMSQSGLQAIQNPSGISLSEPQIDSKVFTGRAVAVIMDGSRSSVIVIQALCKEVDCISKYSVLINGCDKSRARMMIDVLMMQVGLKLQRHSIHLNVVRGLTLSETAGDLAVAAAICSSFLEFRIPPGVAFIAEIGLGGELHKVPHLEKRVITAAKLGFKLCVVPSSSVKFLLDSLSTLHSSAVKTQSDSQSALVKNPDGMKILGCQNLTENDVPSSGVGSFGNGLNQLLRQNSIFVYVF